jgi:hypothetical protein
MSKAPRERPSFDRLRMKLSLLNEPFLMVSQSNHGQHLFSGGLPSRKLK